jgi:hypothetical protein
VASTCSNSRCSGPTSANPTRCTTRGRRSVAGVAKRRRGGRHPADHEQRHERGEDDQALPAGVVAVGVDVVELCTSPGGEHRSDVHDDEDHKPAQPQEVASNGPPGWDSTLLARLNRVDKAGDMPAR